MKIKILIILFLISVTVNAQQGKVFDLTVNNNKGTILVREIRKCNDLPKDSANIHVRIFMPFWRQIKNHNNNPIKLLLIDKSKYSLNDSGFVEARIKKGWHTIGIDYSYDSTFTPFRDTKLKLKKKREYLFDIYLSTPFHQGQY